MELKVSETIPLLAQTMEYNLNLGQEGAPAHKYKVVFLRGEPGIGKTSGHRQAVDLVKAKYDFYRSRTLIPAQYAPEDLGGYPWPEKETQLVKRYRPAWMPMEGVGSLLMDEVPQCFASSLNILAQFTHERRIGEHKLAPGWNLTMAGNRRSDRAAVQDMPRHFTDRCIFIDVVTSAPDVIDHGVENGWAHEVVTYLKVNPENAQKFEAKQEISPTARGWEEVSDLINSGVYDGKALRAMVEGTVGPAAGHSFWAFFGLKSKLPDPRQCLSSPDSAPIPSDREATYALAGALAYHVDRKTVGGFNKYLNRLETEGDNCREITVFSVQMALSRDKSVFMTEKGMEMLERYSEIVL